MTARQLHRIEPVAPRRRAADDRAPVAAWMDDAPCRREMNVFFSEDKDDIARAKQICTTQCSLASRISCMDYSFDNELEYGVWGGISRAERIEKECTQCGQVKLLGEFRRREDSPDGYRSMCRVCVSRMDRKSRSAEVRSASVVRLTLAQERRAAELDKRVRQYAALLAEHSRDEVIRIMEITKRTAQRYDMRLREEQEVAA